MPPRYLHQPDIESAELLDIMSALSDPVRLRLFARLLDGEYHLLATELADLEVKKSTMSHHAKVMREAGLTTTRIVGRQNEMRLRLEELDERFPGLIEGLRPAAREAEATTRWLRSQARPPG
ncbi:ArsR/SmtB family transcription factor [Frigoribacterium sp. 2-23]|uniref:ArsR/SmtB family transcription factor n=1 Tax=Frigoribacterium sp. 2-23 TaxID=3415006 RepID=UPI003C703FEB